MNQQEQGSLLSSKAVTTDRGGGNNTVQSLGLSRQLEPWCRYSYTYLGVGMKKSKAASRSQSHGSNMVFSMMPSRDVYEMQADCDLPCLLYGWVLRLNFKSSIRMTIPEFPPVFPDPALGAIKLQGRGMILWLLPSSYSPNSYQSFPLAKPDHKAAGKEAWEMQLPVVNPRVKEWQKQN